MSILPRIGIVHAPFGAANLREISEASQDSCDPVLIFREAIARRNPGLVEIARRLFSVRLVPDSAVVTAAHDLRLDGVTTFSDGELEFADRIAQDLGLPGAPGTENPWDKLCQRQGLRVRGLSTVHAQAVNSAEDLGAAVAAVGLPGVLKPRRGVSGAGVAFIESPDDVKYQQRMRQRWTRLLLEGVIPAAAHPTSPGRLAGFVSVETISTNRHQHIAVLDYPPISVARRSGADGADAVSETGAVFPSRLPPDDLARLRTYVSECLSALGVYWRVTHTQIMLTAAGPEIVEINGRAAGYNARLLRLAGGPDLIQAAMAVAAGGEAHLPASDLRATAMLLMPQFPVRGGTVRSVVPRGALRSLPGVMAVDEVARQGQARDATGHRMATLMLRARTWTELDDAADTVRHAIDELFAADTGLTPKGLA